MANREPSRDFAEEVYASCMTVGFSNDDVLTLKAMLDVAETPDRETPDRDALVATALRAQTAALRWATRG